MRPPGVAGRFHPIILTQLRSPCGRVIHRWPGQIAERCRQRDGASWTRGPASGVSGILKTGGQGLETRAALNPIRMCEARPRPPDVRQPVSERSPIDCHAQPVHRGDIRHAQLTRFGCLTKDRIAARTIQGSPRAHAPLQSPPDMWIEGRIPPQQFTVHRHGPDLTRFFQQGHHHALKDILQWIGPPPSPRLDLLGRKPTVRVDPITRRSAETRLGRDRFNCVCFLIIQSKPRVCICHMASGPAALPMGMKDGHLAPERSQTSNGASCRQNFLPLSPRGEGQHPPLPRILTLIVANSHPD